MFSSLVKPKGGEVQEPTAPVCGRGHLLRKGAGPVKQGTGLHLQVFSIKKKVPLRWVGESLDQHELAQV